jgi:hypothetical protein
MRRRPAEQSAGRRVVSEGGIGARLGIVMTRPQMVCWGIGMVTAFGTAMLQSLERRLVPADDVFRGLDAARAKLRQATGREPTHVYVHPDDARGMIVMRGLCVRTCPELPRGKVVVAFESGCDP